MNKERALLLGSLVTAAYAMYAGTPATLPTDLKIEDTLCAHENGRQVPFGFIASETTPAGEHLVYVVIRGTCSLLEWLDDGFIIPAKFPPGGNVAGGFSGIYRELAPQIFKTLKSVAGLSSTIYVTGHSLGAALAHLAAADILFNLKLTSESYTFCGPRCGDPVFAAALAASGLVTWRVFNTEDVVPTVPMATTSATTGLKGAVDWVLGKLDHGDGEFLHVGTPVPITFNRGSLEANHDLANVLAALA